jgi:hypothetical protein
MAQSPRFKVYSPAGNYLGCMKEIEDCTAVVILNGDGSTIRDGHKKIIWKEGDEELPAAESYDYVSETCWSRIYDPDV